MINTEYLEQAEKSEDFFNNLNKLLNNSLKKEFNGTEFEIKLSLNTLYADLYRINKDISDIFENKGHFFIHRVQNHTNFKVFFFFSEIDNFEYSVFLYNNKIMMKVKKHEKIKVKTYTICKSSETFIYDYNIIINILYRIDVKFIGTIQKERVKDFIIDTERSIIYASAISLCTCENKKQIQYEIEYFGHYQTKSSTLTETKIIEELIRCSDVLTSNSNFVPNEETKFEFLNKNKKIIESKEQILNEIKKLMEQF